MRMKTILSLCCFVALLFAGAALFAEPAPAPAAAPVLDSGVQPAAALFCPAPAANTAKPIPGGPTASSACPVTLWQQCYQRYGTCMTCFCLGSACECENHCV
jgi:hypothetical protein